MCLLKILYPIVTPSQIENFSSIPPSLPPSSVQHTFTVDLEAVVEKIAVSSEVVARCTDGELQSCPPRQQGTVHFCQSYG